MDGYSGDLGKGLGTKLNTIKCRVKKRIHCKKNLNHILSRTEVIDFRSYKSVIRTVRNQDALRYIIDNELI